MSLSYHLLSCSLCAEHTCLKIQGHHMIPFTLWHVDSTLCNSASGIVDHYVKLPVLFYCCIDQLIDTVHTCRAGICIIALGIKLWCHSFAVCCCTACNYYLYTIACKCSRDSKSKAFCSACYDSHLTFKIKIRNNYSIYLFTHFLFLLGFIFDDYI